MIPQHAAQVLVALAARLDEGQLPHVEQERLDRAWEHCAEPTPMLDVLRHHRDPAARAFVVAFLAASRELHRGLTVAEQAGVLRAQFARVLVGDLLPTEARAR
jgi:hypothetical protein